MKPVYAIASNVITPLGSSVSEVWTAIKEGRRGVKAHTDPLLSQQTFWASAINNWADILKVSADSGHILSYFESLCLSSIRAAMADIAIRPSETILILATTKGNIEWLAEEKMQERRALSNSGRTLAACCGIPGKPAVISHACVSGVTALQYGARLLENGRYKNAVVVGGDRLSRFVLSGFQSFQAVADEACRPFDAARRGINLGEAGATIILSTEAGDAPLARLCGGATSNDANHISGPSRSGIELSRAISNTLKEAGITPNEVNAISAHGTATLYNDEMEAKAFAHAGVIHAPLHSLKGYLGHTLGAAGILESALLIESLQRQALIPSTGYESCGVSEPVNVTQVMQPARIRYALKTASGFGGCNAAILWGTADRF